jgi:hypothetical protein
MANVFKKVFNIISQPIFQYVNDRFQTTKEALNKAWISVTSPIIKFGRLLAESSTQTFHSFVKLANRVISPFQIVVSEINQKLTLLKQQLLMFRDKKWERWKQQLKKLQAQGAKTAKAILKLGLKLKNTTKKSFVWLLDIVHKCLKWIKMQILSFPKKMKSLFLFIFKTIFKFFRKVMYLVRLLIACLVAVFKYTKILAWELTDEVDHWFIPPR